MQSMSLIIIPYANMGHIRPDGTFPVLHRTVWMIYNTIRRTSCCASVRMCNFRALYSIYSYYIKSSAKCATNLKWFAQHWCFWAISESLLLQLTLLTPADWINEYFLSTTVLKLILCWLHFFFVDKKPILRCPRKLWYDLYDIYDIINFKNLKVIIHLLEAILLVRYVYA